MFICHGRLLEGWRRRRWPPAGRQTVRIATASKIGVPHPGTIGPERSAATPAPTPWASSLSGETLRWHLWLEHEISTPPRPGWMEWCAIAAGTWASRAWSLTTRRISRIFSKITTTIGTMWTTLLQEKKGRSRITFYLEDGTDTTPAGPGPAGCQGFKDAHAGKYGTLLMTLENLKDADWENNWKQYYKPMEIGEPPAGDPGMGTGCRKGLKYAGTGRCP